MVGTIEGTLKLRPKSLNSIRVYIAFTSVMFFYRVLLTNADSQVAVCVYKLQIHRSLNVLNLSPQKLPSPTPRTL